MHPHGDIRGRHDASVPERATESAPTNSAARRGIATALGHLLYRSGLYRLAWRNRAVVVLFHRVDDRFPEDPLTLPRARFAAFCDFFARYFVVVTLGELLERLRRGKDISRHLVITFDDGYRDNHRVAAIELRERSLPACFFITSGFVGSERVAWWDARQAIRSEWMSWSEVRSLYGQGFEVGAHTVTHADCGQIGGEHAAREIAGSKAHLEAVVGAPIVYFAYPYGAPGQMTEENRSIVRAAGFECCVSAYGGTVDPDSDPFHLRRVPLSQWYRSPYQFGFDAIRLWLTNRLRRPDELIDIARVADRGAVPSSTVRAGGHARDESTVSRL
jgi:peptidoglycan/xylan/chitin deacetylase (PgdA/CDA1 family)